MEIVLSDSDPFSFSLPCIETLKQFPKNLYNAEYDLPHPAAIISSSWRIFMNNAIRFMDIHDDFENESRRTSPNLSTKPSLDDLLSSYKQVIYSATELIENMTENIPKCLFSKDEDRKQWHPQILARWKKHPTVMCNKLKHNHNVLIAVGFNYQFGTALGFSVCSHINETLKPNQEIHKRQEAFSYGCDLRKILAGIYLIADSVRTELEKFANFQTKVPSTENTNEREYQKKFLERVSLFSRFSFPDQNIATTAGITFDDSNVKISDSMGMIWNAGNGLRNFTVLSGDGHTKSFYLLYSRGAKK